MSRKKVFTNLIWRFLERCGAQGVTFLVSIVLARLLEPEAYGTVALITVFTTILQVFVDSGMGNALIQKKDADEIDFSSVFYFNIATCIVLYILMFFEAPFIAGFYNRIDMIPMIRALSLILIISGVKNVQQAYVSKYFLFKKFFFATLAGTIGAAVIGICMAYLGFGAWAIIIQMLFNALIDTIVLWITVKWRPKRLFSWIRLKKLLSYGWKLLASSLLDTIYNDLTSLIIGKKYSPESLAYYEQGQKFPRLFVNNINSAIDSVLLPALAQEQDIIARVREMTRRSIQVSIYIMAPIMVGLAACGEPLIRLVLTDKWLPCLPYLRLFCIVYMLYPLQTANLNAIKAIGRSDLFLKLEIIKKTVGFSILLVSMRYGVMAMAVGVMVTRVIYQIINSWPNKKLFDYGISEIAFDIMPSIGISLIMGMIVYGITFLHFSDTITLVIQIPIGVCVYFIGSCVFHISSMQYIKNILYSFIKMKRSKNG